MKTIEIADSIISGIRDYFARHSFSKTVIGLSGGIDSSVTAFLAVNALGNENVIGILMPEEGLTSDASINDAMEVINMLKIKHYQISINNFINQFHSFNNENNELAIANAKARIRMSVLYYFASINNALVTGTSDKSEVMLGYGTKHGDFASDILPIGDLWKTEVKELGRFLGVSKKIINKKSTGELIAGYTAEKELGAEYEILDKIMRLHLEENLHHNAIIEKGFNEELVRSVFDRIRSNEHKRRMPAVIKVFSNRS